MSTNDPYAAYKNLRAAGWFRNFDVSQDGKGHLCIPVPGAPSLGSREPGLLWAGSWTKPVGTTLFQRSNMDRTCTTIVLGPMGNILHEFQRPTMRAAGDHILTLNII